jgi:hypothetical protein
MIDAAIQQDKTKVTLPSDIPIVASAESEYPPPSGENADSASRISTPDQSAVGYEKFNQMFQDQ